MKKIIRYLKKIAYLPQVLSKRCSDYELINDVKWMKELYDSYLKWKRIFHNYPFQYYMYNIVQRIKYLSNSEENYNIIRKSWIKYFAQASEDEKYFLSKMFSLTGIFDDQICEEIIRFAKSTSDERYRYWSTQDISGAVFNLQKGSYNGFYNDRKELLKQVALDGNYRIPSKGKSGVAKNICIVTYLLTPNLLNSMTRVAYTLSNGMKRYYDNIYIISLDSFFISKYDNIGINTISNNRNVSAIKKRKEIDSLFKGVSKVLYLKSKTYKGRFQEALDIIYELNPTAIFDMSDEYSPISFYYHQDFTTIYMPLRVGATSSYFSAIEGVRWRVDELNSKYHFIKDEKIIDWSLPESIPPIKTTLTRNELGLKENSFIILTIAKCRNCCNNEFVDYISKLLYENESFVWLIVGDTAPDYLKKNYASLITNKSVVELPYEPHLRELCSICDVLLRTETTGGSGATAIAAISGLPIAMTNSLCDPMRWLGRDYSTIDNYKDLMLRIKRLYEDKGFYNAESQRTFKLAEKASSQELAWEKLKNEVENIIELEGK